VGVRVRLHRPEGHLRSVRDLQEVPEHANGRRQDSLAQAGLDRPEQSHFGRSQEQHQRIHRQTALHHREKKSIQRSLQGKSGKSPGRRTSKNEVYDQYVKIWSVHFYTPFLSDVRKNGKLPSWAPTSAPLSCCRRWRVTCCATPTSPPNRSSSACTTPSP
jgi:hypothetical protein